MTGISQWKAIGAATMLVVACSACSKFTVQVDRDPAADFAPYRTFAWLAYDAAPPDDQDVGDRQMDARLRTFVESDLQRKGYAMSGERPDLLVTYRLVRTDGYAEPTLPYGVAWQRGTYRSTWHSSADSYERGTLIIDVIDRAKNDLVWRGSASARLLPHLAFAERVERAQQAVAKIFATFPPR